MSPQKAQYDKAVEELKDQGANEEQVADFKRNQILIKSINLVNDHAHELEEKRKFSPTRYDKTQAKVKTINPYAKLLSANKFNSNSLKEKHPKLNESSVKEGISPYTTPQTGTEVQDLNL